MITCQECCPPGHQWRFFYPDGTGVCEKCKQQRYIIDLQENDHRESVTDAADKTKEKGYSNNIRQATEDLFIAHVAEQIPEIKQESMLAIERLIRFAFQSGWNSRKLTEYAAARAVGRK